MRALSVSLLSMALLAAPDALAQAKADRPVAQSKAEKAAAQAKFDEAKALMGKRRFAEACARLEESLRIDDAMAARFRLAECYEKAARLASAWINYVDVADSAQAAKMPDREKVARSRADALKPRLLTLTLQVPDELAKIPGLEIKRNGEIVGAKLWNTALPVDAGEQRIEASAPGKKPWSGATTTAGEGHGIELAIGPMVDDETRKDSGSSGGAEGASSRQRTQRILGAVGAGAGAAGMIVGVVVGLVAKGQYDGSEPHCQEDLCDAEGLRIRADARGLGNVGTGVFVAGAVLAAAGVVVILTAPSSPAKAGALSWPASGKGASPAAAWSGVGIRVGIGKIELGGSW